MTHIKFNHQDTSGIDDTVLQSGISRMEDILNELKENSEIVALPSDASVLSEVTSMVEKKKTDRLKYVYVIGIGGSNLGAMAVYDALLKNTHGARLIFADTVSPALLHDILKTSEAISHSEEILINVISKSGGTTETVANFEIMYQHFQKKFPDINARTVATTGENSKLWNKAHELSIDCLKIPEKIGGRYSVFSAVGLFPLMLIECDIGAFREGAQEILNSCLESNLSNPALVSAIILHEQYKNGYVINDNFFFNPELESLGKWYRQLMAESIGKEYDTHGNKVNIGITPTVSIGSTDLHSMVQLYLGGPRNKVTTFVYSSQHDLDITIPEHMVLDDIVGGLAGKNVADVMDAIYMGVKSAYAKKGLPFTEIDLPEISEHTLGQYMQMKMIEMIVLGSLLKVDPFDQPNVEDYKKETQEILNT
jgi:glucose-6-phosphate isomerase